MEEKAKMIVKSEGRYKTIVADGEADAAELSTLLVESATYEVQMIQAALSEMGTGQKPVGRHTLLGIQPWLDRLDHTVELLFKVLE